MAHLSMVEHVCSHVFVSSSLQEPTVQLWSFTEDLISEQILDLCLYWGELPSNVSVADTGQEKALPNCDMHMQIKATEPLILLQNEIKAYFPTGLFYSSIYRLPLINGCCNHLLSLLFKLRVISAVKSLSASMVTAWGWGPETHFHVVVITEPSFELTLTVMTWGEMKGQRSCVMNLEAADVHSATKSSESQGRYLNNVE